MSKEKENEHGVKVGKVRYVAPGEENKIPRNPLNWPCLADAAFYGIGAGLVSFLVVYGLSGRSKWSNIAVCLAGLGGFQISYQPCMYKVYSEKQEIEDIAKSLKERKKRAKKLDAKDS